MSKRAKQADEPLGPDPNAKAPGARCTGCPARGGVMVRPVPAAVSTSAAIAFVDDAPRYADLAAGKPFAGHPGRMLDAGCRAALDLSPAQTHRSLAVLCDCRPSDLPKARKHCAERLRLELAQCGAPVIVPLGGYAVQSILQLPRKPRLQEWRGSVSKAKLTAASGPEIFVTPTIHPHFAHTVPQWRPWLELDFERIARVRATGFTAPEDEAADRIVVAHTPGDAERLLSQLDRTVAIDVETLGLGPTQTPLVCLAIADAQHSIVIPWSADRAGAHAFWSEPNAMARMLTSMLARRIAVTHNGPAFDHIVLARYGIHVSRWDDTLLAAHALDGHMPKRLQHVATTYLDLPPWKAWEHAERIEDLWRYNGRDSLYTIRTWLAMRPKLRAENMRGVYEIDKRAASLCTDMQVNGLRFDAERASEMQARLEAREAELQAKAETLLGRSVNLLSPKQLARAFIGPESVGGYVCFRSASGAPVLNVDVLRAYAASANERLSEFALTVLDFRRVRKVKSTNLRNPAKLLDSASRIHATWLNYGAVSGRFASQGPNLMNLPTVANDPTIVHCGGPRCAGKCKCDCDRCGGVRSIYCAPPGYTLLAFDAKQLEMRIAAYASGDEAMIAACESSDLHTANAERVFGEAFINGEAALRFKLRQLAKSGGFAICYGAEASTVHARMVAAGTDVELRMVERFLRLLKQAFRGYYQWQERQLREIAACGYVYEPVTGRRRWLGDEPKVTEAMNFPIQAGAAGLMNTRLPMIVEGLRLGYAPSQRLTEPSPDFVNRASRIPFRLVAQVHDSATFELPESAQSDAERVIREIFEAPISVGGRMASFPLDFKASRRWL